MIQIAFKKHRFPPEFIQHAVWLYARFTLSFRDVQDLMAERGIDVSNETVRRWFLKFGRLVSANLRHSSPRSSAHWHLDEMVIKIRDQRYWLCRRSMYPFSFMKWSTISRRKRALSMAVAKHAKPSRMRHKKNGSIKMERI